MAIEKKKIESFTPEAELEEDGSGETRGSGKDQGGDDEPDFFTWLEKTTGDKQDASGGKDQFDTFETDGIRLRTGISEG